MTPSFSKLSASQVRARSSGKQERMVVVFDDQLANLPANRTHRQARQARAASMQAPLVTQLKQVGATHITRLSILNAVAAAMPAAEARALSHTKGVKEVVPDGTIIIGDATSKTKTVAASQVRKSAISATAADGQQSCNAPGGRPLVEPEALTSIHDTNAIATGQGVIVGNVNADTLAGNPNMIRPNGQHVIIDAPDPTENVFSDEFNGDVSTIAAQGTVTYTYASQLPFSNIPANCSFRIVGDAPGASSSHYRLLLRHQLGGSDRGSRVAGHRRAAAGDGRGCQRRIGVLRLRRSAGCQRRPARADERRHGGSRRGRGRERGRQRLVRHGRGSRR